MSFQLTGTRFKAWTDAGAPLVGGLLYTYVSGTTTNKATYTDSTLGGANTNPVVLDARGEADVWLGSGAYTFVVKTAAGVTIDTEDGVVDPQSAADAAIRADLASNDSGKGAALLGVEDSAAQFDATDAEAALAEVATWVGRQYLVTGIDPTGATDAQPRIQAVIDYAAAQGGGVVRLPPGPGTYKIGGTSFVDVKANVRFIGNGYATRLVSETAGSTAAVHVLVYLKDYASIENMRLSGSDYFYSSSLVTGVAYNKQGITTQGAASGVGMRVKNVGFEKFGFSHVYVYNGHHDVKISDCYTFGQQVGHYADINGSHAVTNWNADETDVGHAAAIAAGTRVYALTNFHNSGVGAYDVHIHGNTLTNVNDSLAAPNQATRHYIYDNYFVKDTTGYYGGYGIDMNGCSESAAWGNTVVGGSYGVYFHDGAVRNSAYGNTLRCAHGVGQNNASRNSAIGNTIILGQHGSTLARAVGPGAGLISGNLSSRFSCLNNVIRPSTISTTVSSLTATNAVAGTAGRIRLTIAAHGMASRQVVDVSGVVGTTEANGVWQTIYIDANTIELAESAFANAYVSGGTVVVALGGNGAVVTDGGGASSMSISGGSIQDLGIGLMCGVTSGSSLTDRGGLEMINVVQTNRGVTTYTNNQVLVSGLSASGVQCRNFANVVVTANGATTTAVTFARAEADASYRVHLSCEDQALNMFVTGKGTGGFTVNHTLTTGARPILWELRRV